MTTLVRLGSNNKVTDPSVNARIPRIPWSEISPEVISEFSPGEHAIILGKTGTGKTYFAFDLMNGLTKERHANCVAFGIKPRDKTLRETGWPIIREWPPTYEQRQHHKIIVWPPYARSNARAKTAPLVRAALEDILMEGAWRVFIDELAYFVQTLGLRDVLDEYWNAARASDLSLIGATQRPAWIARSAVTQVDWSICFRLQDTEDQKRAAEIMGDRNRFAPVIQKLSKPRHEFLIVRDEDAVLSWID